MYYMRLFAFCYDAHIVYMRPYKAIGRAVRRTVIESVEERRAIRLDEKTNIYRIIFRIDDYSAAVNTLNTALYYIWTKERTYGLTG